MQPLTEGLTGPLRVQLLDDDQPPAGGLTGMTVALVLKDSSGALVDTTGAVTVTDEGQAKLEINLAAGALVAAKSPYTAHYKVTDGAGKVTWWPNGQAETWLVFPQ